MRRWWILVLLILLVCFFYRPSEPELPVSFKDYTLVVNPDKVTILSYTDSQETLDRLLPQLEQLEQTIVIGTKSDLKVKSDELLIKVPTMIQEESKVMNYLLSASLKDSGHVLWINPNVIGLQPTILKTLSSYKKDILTVNCLNAKKEPLNNQTVF